MTMTAEQTAQEVAHAAIPGLTEASEALGALRAQREQWSNAARPPADLAVQLAATLLAGEPVPDGFELAAHDAELWHARRETGGEVLARVEVILEGKKTSALADGADAGLLALRPRLDGVLGQARRAAPMLAGIHTADDAVAAGSPAVDAWRQLDDAARHYREIREVQRTLTRIGERGQVPVAELLAVAGEIANMDETFPAWRPMPGRNPATAPWPDAAQGGGGTRERLTARHTMAYVRWLAEHPVAVPWIPTRAELGENYEAQVDAWRQRAYPTPGRPLGDNPDRRAIQSQLRHQGGPRRIQDTDGSIIEFIDA